MSDLISRQAAIDAIDRLDIQEDMCVFEILSHIELEIGNLPSAQPEPLSDAYTKIENDSEGREYMTFKLDKCYDCEYHEMDGMCVLKEYETDDNDICPDFSCAYNYCSYDDEMESKC